MVFAVVALILQPLRNPVLFQLFEIIQHVIAVVHR